MALLEVAVMNDLRALWRQIRGTDPDDRENIVVRELIRVVMGMAVVMSLWFALMVWLLGGTQ